MANECYNSSFEFSAATKQNECHNRTFECPNNPANDALNYIYIVVLIFGILGNSLVIISILRQRNLLKSNYYFLVFHLAFCDLGYLCLRVYNRYPLKYSKIQDCLILSTDVLFNFAGIAMMLVVSVLRYRATLHPLEPAISRRKLKVVCSLVYIITFIVGYGANFILSCPSNPKFETFSGLTIMNCLLFLDHVVPSLFMAVVYYKICLALVKQHKYMKSICSNPSATQNTSSSYKFARYIRNQRTFLISLCTVVSYAIGKLPFTMFSLMCSVFCECEFIAKDSSFMLVSSILRVVGSNAINPLIYGILDKKLLLFCKICSKKGRKEQRIKPA